MVLNPEQALRGRPRARDRLNQGANSGNGRIVQNYVEQELAAYKVSGKGPEDTGVRVKVKGHPASIRIAPR